MCDDAEVTTSSRPSLDREAIEHRLITMRKSIEQLESAGRVTVARLAENPATGLAVERILAILDDLALAINRHVCVVALGELPQTSARSLRGAHRAGLIDVTLAEALMPAEGPPNVLVQLSLDCEPEAIETIVEAAISAYRDYVRQVSVWTSTR